MRSVFGRTFVAFFCEIFIRIRGGCFLAQGKDKSRSTTVKRLYDADVFYILLEIEIYTHCKIGIGTIDRNKLRCNLKELMIRSNKQIEAFRVEIDQPAK